MNRSIIIRQSVLGLFSSRCSISQENKNIARLDIADKVRGAELAYPLNSGYARRLPTEDQAANGLMVPKDQMNSSIYNHESLN
jgi:hypothetical protein